MTPLKLQLAIATNRIDSLRLPPVVPGVGIVIAWQNHNGRPVPAGCLRNDVTVVRCDRPGLSNNRNLALDHCSAPVVLIADDDLLYTPSQLKDIIEAFNMRPSMELAVFKVRFPYSKSYPAEECVLRNPLPRGFSVTSMEIAFRNPLPVPLSFHPALGLGSTELPADSSLECGEEELFLHMAIRAGLHCRFIPIEICTHPQLTTGQKPPTPGVLRGMGAVIRIMWPSTWPLRLVLKAVRLSNSHSAFFFRTLYHLFRGSRLSDKIR